MNSLEMVEVSEKKTPKKDPMQAGLEVQDIIAVKIIDQELTKLMLGKEIIVDKIISEANKNSENISNEKFDDIILYKENKILTMYQVKNKSTGVDSEKIKKELEKFEEYNYENTIDYRLIIVGEIIDIKEIIQKYKKSNIDGVYPESITFEINNYLKLEVVPFSWFDLGENNLSNLRENSVIMKSLSDIGKGKEYENYLLKKQRSMRVNFLQYEKFSDINYFFNDMIEDLNIRNITKSIKQELGIDKLNYIKRDNTISNIIKEIDKNRNLIITGHPGVGKSYLAHGVYEELKKKK